MHAKGHTVAAWMVMGVIVLAALMTSWAMVRRALRPGADQEAVETVAASWESIPNGRVRVSECAPESSGAFLHDGDARTIWVSESKTNDLFFGLTFEQPVEVKRLALVVHADGPGTGVRDISVVATREDATGNPEFRVLDARITRGGPYFSRLSVPGDLSDGTVLYIDIDPQDADFGRYRTWGLASLSASKGYARNGAGRDTRVSVREMAAYR